MIGKVRIPMTFDARQRGKIEFTTTFGIHGKIFRWGERIPRRGNMKADLRKICRETNLVRYSFQRP